MDLLPDEAIPLPCEVVRGHAYVWLWEKRMTQFSVIIQPMPEGIIITHIRFSFSTRFLK